jgi:hypothetical protein
MSTQAQPLPTSVPTQPQPELEVSGDIILAFLNGIASEKYQELALRILTAHGLKNPQSGAWFPHSAWLKALQQMNRELGPNTLFMIGKQIPRTLHLPLRLRVARTMEDALSHLDPIYRLNHRMKDDAEMPYHYEVQRIGQQKVHVSCHNPYPAEINRGIIIQTARAMDPGVTVELKETTTTTQVFTVVWGEE